jgi:hypothetical protein
MLQAQGLRTRIEIRVNRIPVALRTAKMGDLYAKYSETAVKSAQKSPHRIEKAASPYKSRMEDIREQTRAIPSPQKPKKRVRYECTLLFVCSKAYKISDEMSIDKENEDIENPKKRVRGAPAPPQRVASRSQIQPSQVLSPRSANSRTLPRSPIRQAPPMKSGLARPVSPLKPTAPVPSGGAAGILTNMVEKAKATRGAGARKAAEPKVATTAAGRGKRTAAAPPPVTRTARGRASTISDSSEGSNTTVVRKPVAAKKEPVKRTVMGTLRGMGGATKKAVAAKPTTTTTTGTRVLRKRN